MRKHLLAVLPLLWSRCAYCQDSSETVLGDHTPAAVIDPSLANSHIFPPSLGTSGVAVIAPKPVHGTGCSPANPCAMPTPARDRVIVTGDKP